MEETETKEHSQIFQVSLYTRLSKTVCKGEYGLFQTSDFPQRNYPAAQYYWQQATPTCTVSIQLQYEQTLKAQKHSKAASVIERIKTNNKQDWETQIAQGKCSNITSNSLKTRASEMALQVKVLVINSDDLSLIPWTHIVDRKNQFLQVVLWPSHMSHSAGASHPGNKINR